jgi:hypothetical protein
MTLTDRYLKAVAAQLPGDTRDDIIAELREAIESRMEDRASALGRPLDEREEEAVLREFGHPLAVAARYGSGPQHVVGPELFPWWSFGVKAALLVLATITAVSVALRVFAGDRSAGQAIAQGFHDLFGGAITVIGVATIIAYVLERQAIKPRFITEWRVRDLGLFQIGVPDPDVSGGPEPAGGRVRVRPRRGTLPPSARAIGTAAVWAVILLWWTGVIEGGPGALTPAVLGPDGDLADLIRETLALLYWPVIAYGAARIAFDLARAAAPGRIRAVALGDLVLLVAWLGLFAWLWLASPLSSVIWVDSLSEFIVRSRASAGDGEWGPTAAIWITWFVALGALVTVGQLVEALWRLVSGRPRAEDRPWLEPRAVSENRETTRA